MSALRALFAPRRVAVLGASRSPAKLGHALLRNVLDGGFDGEVLVVHPEGEPLLGRPTVRDPSALPEGLDLALVSLPPAAVLPAVEALAARRVRAAVILTSGFGEVDARGRVEQQALLTAARAGGLRLVGPNCMGVFSAPARLNATYFWDLPRLPGGIAVISQSGAYGGLIIRHLGGLGLGVSRFLSIGNQVDVTISEALDYLADDPETRLIACFIEALRDGREFVDAARRATATKPVVALKGGRGEAGRRAAGSHTGSLAGSAAVYHAAFRSAGVVACADTEEFFDAVHALATTTLRPRAPSACIVTVSGGPSVAAADIAEALGISIPVLPPDVQESLRSRLPSFAAVGNPVDLTPQASPHLIPQAVGAILSEKHAAGAIAINVGLDVVEFADGLAAAARAAGLPLVACSVDAPRTIARFGSAGVPVYPTPERAVRAYHSLWRAGLGAEPTPAAAVSPVLSLEVQSLLASAHGAMPYDVARAILSAYGIRFCRDAVADTETEAVEAARRIGLPVVVKTARADVLHKTEVGGVVTGVASLDGVAQACRRISAGVGPGPLVVQQQVARGVELLVGARRDETFGPVVAVGLGGFLAEAVGDVSVALAPVSATTAARLVPLGLRGRLMAGYRGLPAWDAAVVAPALVAVGRILADHPRVREIDVNPLVALADGAVAVDALVVLG